MCCRPVRIFPHAHQIHSGSRFEPTRRGISAKGRTPMPWRRDVPGLVALDPDRPIARRFCFRGKARRQAVIGRRMRGVEGRPWRRSDVGDGRDGERLSAARSGPNPPRRSGLHPARRMYEVSEGVSRDDSSKAAPGNEGYAGSVDGAERASDVRFDPIGAGASPNGRGRVSALRALIANRMHVCRTEGGFFSYPPRHPSGAKRTMGDRLR